MAVSPPAWHAARSEVTCLPTLTPALEWLSTWALGDESTRDFAQGLSTGPEGSLGWPRSLGQGWLRTGRGRAGC